MTTTSSTSLLRLTFFTSLLCFIGFQPLFSQQSNSTEYSSSSVYKTAIGVRAGGTSGLTFKRFISSQNAIEVIVWGNRNWLGITGLYEFYKPAFNTAGLNWYYGVGAHVNFYDNSWGWSKNQYNENVIGLGVDGIAGIEYKIKPIPIALSLDLKPNIEVYTNGNLGWHLDPGFGIKFAF